MKALAQARSDLDPLAPAAVRSGRHHVEREAVRRQEGGSGEVGALLHQQLQRTGASAIIHSLKKKAPPRPAGLSVGLRTVRSQVQPRS
jgi:hypothetical protein